MNKNRVEGATKQVNGAVKEAVGKVIGSQTTRAEGIVEKTAGKVQSAVGKAQTRTVPGKGSALSRCPTQ